MNHLCGKCIKCPPYFDRTVIPFYYEEPLTNLIFQLKFYEQLGCITFFTHFLAKKIKQQSALPEVMIPVPLSKTQLRKRGYNQSLELAKRLRDELRIPISRHACRRIKATKLQHTLNAKARENNVKGNFTIVKNFSYQHVAIVDDVLTTGATVNEIAKLLKQNGVRIVEVWCCARAAD